MFAELYQFTLRIRKQQQKFNTSQFVEQQTKLTCEKNIKPLLPIHQITKPHKTKQTKTNQETSKAKIEK